MALNKTNSPKTRYHSLVTETLVVVDGEDETLDLIPDKTRFRWIKKIEPEFRFERKKNRIKWPTK